MKKRMAAVGIIAAVVAGLLGTGMLSDHADAAAKKPLAIYFSYAENIDTNGMSEDAIASASISGDSVNRKMDNIKLITQEVKSKKKADTFSITVKKKYNANFDKMAGVAKKEIDKDKKIKLAPAKVKNLSDYDTIYLGTPIWWYSLPQPVVTFLRSNDFSGKTIYVYGIHEGSGWENNIEKIQELCPDATVVKGITVYGDAPAKSVKKRADKWLDGIK